MKYPLKQQKAHSLVLTQIIQPGTRSRKTESEGEKSLSPHPQPPPPRSGTVRLHVSYFTPPETRCNFPSPFQQSLVNTLCGETRASPAFRRSRAGAGKPGRGAGAGRTPCRGWGGGTVGQKQDPPEGSAALATVVAVLPGPQALLPAGWELPLRVRRQRQGPFVVRAAVAPRGAQGQAPRGSISRGASCERPRIKGDGTPRVAPSRNRSEGAAAAPK